MINCRKIAVEILIDVFYKSAYSNIVLNTKLKSSNLNDKDKALVTEIVYGTIKYKYTIDKILNCFLHQGLNSLDYFTLNILRISIYQIKYLDRIPDFAVVDEAVRLVKKFKSIGASKLVNGVLRNYLRNPKKIKYEKNNFIKRMCFEYSYPKWMVELFKNQYGEEYCQFILRGLNEKPDVTVRVNSLKGDYDKVIDTLLSNSYELQKGYICPEAIKIIKGKSVENNPLFNSGIITVQDESAMLVAPIMDLKENMQVLDLCSAPGGKTTHMAEIMNNKGNIFAFDIHKNKLRLVENNITRLGIKNVKCSIMNAECYNDDLNRSAQRVLIDVPCSGLGIIRKKPEIKWNKSKKQLNNLIKIQRNILNNAAKYVKVGGSLIYSTCTLNKEENGKNILWFLNGNTKFQIEPLYFGEYKNILYSKEGFVTILPNKYMDGFFISKMKRLE